MHIVCMIELRQVIRIVVMLCAGAGFVVATPAADTGDMPVYLFATFREPEQDGLRFAYSFDGYHETMYPDCFSKRAIHYAQWLVMQT